MRTPRLKWIRPEDPPGNFPDASTALRDPDGLLAVGGDLSPARLLYAYRHGIFPWYHGDQPILWWSPDPRAVLIPDGFHLSASLRKRLRQGRFRITFDTAFNDVVAACAAPRVNQPEGGTWITPAMRAAYVQLHRMGYAHSVEVWMDDELAGGLYGIALGAAFFGESMFSRRRDASKIALACLSRRLQVWGFALLDCQVQSEHLQRLGAIAVPRREFLELLARECDRPMQVTDWRAAFNPEF
jgi:leucyl/phenylalanyl-tRNA---protein transferase